MKITDIEISNVKCFERAYLSVSGSINLLVGPNNSGKSTVINTLLSLQDGSSLNGLNPRFASDHSKSYINFTVKTDDTDYFGINSNYRASFSRISISLYPNRQRKVALSDGRDVQVNAISSIEPNNLIYPFLSKRKVASFQETVNLSASNSVSNNLANLYPKIDRISNPNFQPAHDEFVLACKDILGFVVSAVPSERGKVAAFIIKNLSNIPISAMGDGISNILGLIVDLCVAENKIFLIEELENDIHPLALKKLLELILRKSKNNQIFISTHSNIVTKYLGADPDTKIFSVQSSLNGNIPTSIVTQVRNSPDDRRELLESLGYDFFDFDMWDEFIFFEESSAERIVRDYLIPWFVPELKKTRTFSARSISEIKTKFDDFNRLFVFVHMSPCYKNKAWLLIDGGDEEKKILDDIRNKYSAAGWEQDRFIQLSEHNFERYFPSVFKEEVNNALNIVNKRDRQFEKGNLLNRVIKWIECDENYARSEFENSAKEIIDILKRISAPK